MNAFAGHLSLEPILAAVAASNPHDGQARADAMDPRRSVVCLAPAGSGKTTELIYRMLACLSVAMRPEEVLAITFTTLAAGEIKERIIDALSLAAGGVEPQSVHEKPLYALGQIVLKRDAELGWNLLVNPGRLRIMTFDSFSAYLAGKTPIMSGLGGGQTTDDPHLLYRQAILETLGSVNDDSAPEELRAALEAVLGFAKNQFEKLVPMFSTLLAKRDQWAHEIIGLDVAEMQMALAHSVAFELQKSLGDLSNGHIDALINVVADAASELPGFEWAANVPADRASETYCNFIRDFSSFILTSDGKLRATVNAKNGFPAGHSLTKRMNEVLKELKGTEESTRYAEALNAIQCLPEVEFAEFSAEMCGHFTVILRYLLANLTLAFEDNAALDFPEVAARAIQALGVGAEIGDALLEEDRINHILVDEVQDSSPNQYYLLSKLTADWSHGDGRSIFFCGDKSQSIYLFRNATPETFNEIIRSKRFGNLELELINLVVNFRSMPAVVEWNNQCYSKVFADSDIPFIPSVPARSGAGAVTVKPISTGALGEAEAVADQIDGLIKADAEASIAILVRARSHIKHILPALKARGITASGQNIDPLSESSPVSEVVALVRSLWHLADRSSWFCLLRAAFVGLSWEDCVTVARGDRIVLHSLKNPAVQAKLSPEGAIRVAAFLKAYDAVTGSSRGDDLSWAAKALWVGLGGAASVDSTELDDVLTVFALLLKHTVNGCLEKPQAFFRAIDSLYATPKPGRVVIMTIHNSKGLEFDHVIIPALNSRGASDDAPLFYWKRINDIFVLAPNPGSQCADNAPEKRLFNYLGRKVKAEINDEIARLAYVMTTRAKVTCTLYATYEKLDEKTEASYAKGSVLESLWPAIEADIRNVQPGIPLQEDVDVGVPSKARLSPGFSFQLPAGVFIPASGNEHAPSENDLNDEGRDEQGNDLCARLEGIVYHKVVEIIGRDGVDLWSVEKVSGKQAAIAAMMRREGYPSESLNAGVQRVIALVVNTLQSAHGQWILKKRDNGGQEVQVSAYRGGRWVHRIIDKSFVEDGYFWIVDWKSPAPKEGVSIEAFVEAEVSRYRAKMEEYRQGVIDAGVDLPVRLALYFPAVDCLREIG